jgi:hypothetical protein
MIGKKKNFYVFMTPKTPLVTREDTPKPPTTLFIDATTWPNCFVHFASLSFITMGQEGGDFVLVKMEDGRKTCGVSSGQISEGTIAHRLHKVQPLPTPNLPPKRKVKEKKKEKNFRDVI